MRSDDYGMPKIILVVKSFYFSNYCSLKSHDRNVFFNLKNAFTLLTYLLPDTVCGELELVEIQEDNGLILNKSAKSVNEF